MIMDRDFLVSFRRTCVMIALFAASFILVYAGVVALTKFVYVYFRGFVPDFNENALRAIFYPVAVASFAVFRAVFKRRYSPGAIGARSSSPDLLVKHLLMTHVIGMALAELVLVCAFFLFFLGAMYVDFIVLALLSAVMIVMGVPSVEFLDSRINQARNLSPKQARKSKKA